MSGRDSKGSGKLLSLTDVFDLTEASAYRVTPDYIYAFRKSKQGTGIVPVHIKHANVPKHWDNLTDPKPGSPLANLVIGLIPKYYKAPTDLKIKDPAQTISDLLKAGESGKTAPFAVNVRATHDAEVAAAPTKPKLSSESLTQAAVLAPKVGIKASAKNAKKVVAQTEMLGWLIQTGNDADAVENYAGGAEADADALEAASELSIEVVAKLKKATSLVSITDDEEGFSHLKFLSLGASPIIQPTPPVPVEPPAPAPAPPPAPKLAPANEVDKYVLNPGQYLKLGDEYRAALPPHYRKMLDAENLNDKWMSPEDRQMFGVLAQYAKGEQGPYKAETLASRLAYVLKKNVGFGIDYAFSLSDAFLNQVAKVGLVTNILAGYSAIPVEELSKLAPKPVAPSVAPPTPEPAPTPSSYEPPEDAKKHIHHGKVVVELLPAYLASHFDTDNPEEMAAVGLLAKYSDTFGGDEASLVSRLFTDLSKAFGDSTGLKVAAKKFVKKLVDANLIAPGEDGELMLDGALDGAFAQANGDFAEPEPPAPPPPAPDTPSAEMPTLKAKGIEFLSNVPGDVQLKFHQALGKKPGDATLAALSVLLDYDDNKGTLVSQLNKALAAAYPHAPYETTDAGASGIAAALKASGIIIESPGGGEFLQYGQKKKTDVPAPPSKSEYEKLGLEFVASLPQKIKNLVASEFGFSDLTVTDKLFFGILSSFVANKPALKDNALEKELFNSISPYYSDNGATSLVDAFIKKAVNLGLVAPSSFGYIALSPPYIPTTPTQKLKAEYEAIGLKYLDALPPHVKSQIGTANALDSVLYGVLGMFAMDKSGELQKGAFRKTVQDAVKAEFPGFDASQISAATDVFIAKAEKWGLVVPSIVGPIAFPLDAIPSSPAPAEAPAPAPVSGLGIPAIPPLDTLKDAGDAKGALGGHHAKRFLKDAAGNKYLFKPSNVKFQAYGAAAYAAVGAKLLDNVVPIAVGEVPGLGFGSVQPMVPNVKTLKDVELTSLSPTQLDSLLQERVMDWVFSAHDSKPANFLVTQDGKLVGIDKEQAFRFIGEDSLDLDYKPNPTEQVWKELFTLYKKKKLPLNLGAMLPVIQGIEKMSDTEWEAIVAPYLSVLSPGDAKKKKALMLARKNSIRKDMEGFITGLLRERGTIGPEDNFEFDGAYTPKPKKPEPAAAVGNILFTPPMPDIDTLSVQSSKLAGATGQTFKATDPAGNKFVLKVAVNRSNGITPEPYRVAAQEIFSQLASVVRPGKSVPAAEVPGGYKGKPALLYPWVDAKGTLEGVHPASLSAAQKKDVAEEHVLDWLLSQHDTHAGNLLIRNDGAVVSIDKEQGFKYFLDNFKYGGTTLQPPEKLSTDFHPNAYYGTGEPYYNHFWRGFADGKLDFDPTTLKGVIERIEAVSDKDYAKLVSKFTSKADFLKPGEIVTLINKALDRKNNIRKEFEAFITEQYVKRTKKKGEFSFDAGWVPASDVPQPVPASSAIPAQPVAPGTSPAPATPPPVAAVGYKPPSYLAVSTAFQKTDIAPKGVYGPALKALADMGSTQGAVDKLVASGISAEMALKRVKYVKKKLDSFGGFAAFEPVPVKIESQTGPKKTVTGLELASYDYPGASGELNALNPKMVTAVTPKLQEQAKAPTPAGFPEPPAGKMWEVLPFSQWQGKHIHKTAAPKDENGNPIPNSPNILIKFKDITVEDTEALLQKYNMTAIPGLGNPPVYSKGFKTYAVVPQAQWDAFVQAAPQMANLIDVPAPQITTASIGKFTTIPEAGQLGNPLAPIGMDAAKDLQNNKQIGYGIGFMTDGDSVEQMSVQATRHVDSGGEFYRFNFKLRLPTWQKLKNTGSPSAFKFSLADYDAAKDAWIDKGPSGPPATFDSRRVDSQGSTVHIGTLNSDKKAYRGFVVADVRPLPGETVYDALKRTLTAVDPAFAEKFCNTPTPEEMRLFKAKALFWSYFPKEADKLTKAEAAGINSAQDFAYVMGRLATKGFTEADVDSVRFEQTALGQSSPVLPGRLARIQKASGNEISHLSISVRANDVDAVVNQIYGATVGVTQRVLNGLPPKGTSVQQDMRTGGAEYVFGNVLTQAQSSQSSGWGATEVPPVLMVMDPSEMERLDWFVINNDDGYGCCYEEDHKGHCWTNRPVADEAVAQQHYEVLFRKGVNSRKLLKVICPNSKVASDVIAALKKKGVTKINGMLPEELVLVQNSSTNFYETQLKPAGY